MTTPTTRAELAADREALRNLQTWLVCSKIGTAAKPAIETVNAWINALESIPAIDALAAAPVAAAGDAKPHSMSDAPLDGTLVQLLVRFDRNGIEDTNEPTWTIGSCNDGEWNFVGWCWHTDEWARGSGDLLGWLPLPSAPGAQPAPSPAQAPIHLSKDAQIAAAEAIFGDNPPSEEVAKAIALSAKLIRSDAISTAKAQAPAQELTETDSLMLNQGIELLQDLAADQKSRGNDSAALGAECSASAIQRLAAALASQPAAQPLTADDLHEPKNGTNWRVEWWNESMRLMLPAGVELCGCLHFKDGALKLTIKRRGIGTDAGTGGAHG